MVIDKVILPVAQQLLGCLDAQVKQLEEPPQRIGLRPGDAIQLWISTQTDECCEGLAWVRWMNKYPSSQAFPNPDPGGLRCKIKQFALVFELGIARCAPSPEADELPSVDEWDALTEQIYADAAALDKTVCCFLDSYRRSVSVGTQEPLAVEGGCVGVRQEIIVAAAPCNCVDVQSPAESPGGSPS